MTRQSLAGNHGWNKESDSHWQPHVMGLLWTILTIAAILIAALLYGEGHGLFQGVSENGAPSSTPWQTGWP